MTRPDPEELLRFWFGGDLETPESLQARFGVWFAQSDAFDDELRARFGDWPEAARSGTLDAWREEPRSLLAFVIAVDQLPRNLFRGTARAFAYDALALAVAASAVDRGFDDQLSPPEVSFLYLPFEHAEDLAAQERCIALYTALAARVSEPMRPVFEHSLDYAVQHHRIIERFGRFPHRNAVLGRRPTPEEERYLAEGGETFS